MNTEMDIAPKRNDLKTQSVSLLHVHFKITSTSKALNE